MFSLPGLSNSGSMPIQASGGHASATTGEQSTQGSVFGAFNYNDKPPYVLFIAAGLAAVWLLTRRK